MIILTNDGGFATNSEFPNTDWTGEAIQIIDDNSELGQKIISMTPNVKLIYTDGVVTDCEDITPELYDTESDIMSMTVDHEYRLTLLELGITEE